MIFTLILCSGKACPPPELEQIRITCQSFGFHNFFQRKFTLKMLEQIRVTCRCHHSDNINCYFANNLDGT